jgi:hypothetical protein
VEQGGALIRAFQVVLLGAVVVIVIQGSKVCSPTDTSFHWLLS